MAPKRILEDPPAASSMEEEEDSDPTEGEEEEEANGVFGPEHDDEDEDEDDDEEEHEENVNERKEKPKPVAAVPISQPESSSDDEDDDGSETESDDDGGIGDFTVKPIVSKPNNATDSAKPSAKKPAAATPTKAPKRAAEADLASKDSKKKKGSGGSGGDDEDTKRGRLWSEEDEIAILKGMIDYKAKKGLDPSANLGPFHEFLKKTLKVDVSKNQLADKMRRLKKKYLTNAEKSENGEDPVFSKAHETKSFDLSKKIWGVEANGADDSAKNSKKKQPRKTANVNAKGNSSTTVLALPVSDASEKKVEVNVANGGGVKVVKDELEDFSVKYPHLSGSLKGGLSAGVERLIFENLPAFGSSKVKDLDAKWKKLQLLELELAVKKLDLMHEQSKLVMDAVNSRKD